MFFFFDDQEFPLINKPVEINDFVINKNEIDEIVPMSVGVVKHLLRKNAKVFFIGKALTKTISVNNLIVIDVHKTGKEEGTSKPPYKYKICNICHILKNQAEEFDYNQNDKQGRPTTRPSCKRCRIEIDGIKLTTSERQRMLNIKPKDYELFECPICHKISIPDVTANIVIDHDHRTGKARTWICDSCNTGIGRFQDNPKMLEEIAAYIKGHNTDLEH